jgi:AraC family transcriptional regulator, regulatory protein of adaptative response / methylated-DNA-[protein]-cysteine methyltransferase
MDSLTKFQEKQSLERKNGDLVSLKQLEGKDFNSKKNPPVISFSIVSTKIGKLIVASTPKGICFVGYHEKGETFVEQLQKRFPHSKIKNRKNKLHGLIKDIFKKDWSALTKIPLHLKGTPFQLSVWQALLEIPYGSITTYSYIAEKVGNPKARRAVGTAIGKNPILFLIPCHRVIAANGKLGGFYYGIDKKVQFLNLECGSKKKKGKLNWDPTLF